MKGCEMDAKYTSANTPIPRALATGNLTLFLESMMTRIVTRDGRVRSVAYVSQQGEEREIQCNNLVLACSAIETARLLLHNGLCPSSGLVGKNLMSHFGVTVTALFPQLRNRDASRDAGTDYFHGLLTGLYWDQPSRDFDGTYQVQVGLGGSSAESPHPQCAGIR
jgi:choline dehydrogenase-like flavoprotein